MYRKPISKDVVIASGATDSPAIEIRDYVIAGLIMPAALDSAALTFEASDEIDGTFVPVYDSDGNQVSVVVAASRALGISGAEADALAPWTFIKIIMGSTESAERTLKLALK